MSTHKAKDFRLENNCFKTPERKEKINLHTPIKKNFGIDETATPNKGFGGYSRIIRKSPGFNKIGNINNFFLDTNKNEGR